MAQTQLRPGIPRAKLGFDALNNRIRPRQHLGTDSDDRPAGRFQQGDPLDIPRPLISVLPVMDAVILNSDLPLTPPHVDPHAQIPKRDLRLRLWKSGAYQQQPHPRLLRRLRTAVGQLQRGPQPPNAASSGVPVGHSDDVCGFDTRGIEQCVEDRYRLGSGQAATDVESGAGRGRHAHSPDRAHLVISQLIAVHNDASLPVPIGAHDLRGRGRVEPFGAEYRGGGKAG